MPLRTSFFKQLPWIGGLNTSLDESVIPPNQLTKADHLIFATRGSRKKRDGNKHNWDSATTGNVSIVGLRDFWYGQTTKTQRLVGVGDNKAIYAYTSSGTRTTLTIDGSATAWSSSVTNCTMAVVNNLCIIAVDGTGNVLRKWAGGSNSVFNLGGTPPIASIVAEHLGRVVCNDKTNCDRFNYSPTGDAETWGGVGDSGGYDIGVGDGDPEGITAIFSFKKDLYIAKRSKLYRLVGDLEIAEVQEVSKAIGVISQNSICITDNDVYFVSERGVHSLVATATYGDVESAFVSVDIQKTFDEDFSRSRLKYCWGSYLDRINSVAFTFTEGGGSANNSVYLYNIPQKAWYRWPNISCQSLIVANDADKKRFYFGTNISRVSKTFNGTNYDISASGTNTAINMRIATGLIFPNDMPGVVNGFKKFSLVYRPQGTHTITTTVKIDNFLPSPENTLNFSEVNSADLLGSTFVLGVSALGYDVVMAPYTRSIDGYGRGFKLSIEQTGVDQVSEIQGFIVEFEAGSTAQEVIT